MKIVLSYSGGLDSTVLLYYLWNNPANQIRCLMMNYGQRHSKELVAGRNILKTMSKGESGLADWQIADLSTVRFLFAGSSQTTREIEVPEGHYEEESMKLTVVPNRNMVLLSLATAWAVATKSDTVAYAAHAGDHAIYPDCRAEFTKAMESAISLCDWHQIKLLRPFIDPNPKSKADIVKLGSELGVPFKLTWSCYKGGEKHCGKCGTCVERQEAFQLARISDPTIYE